MDEYDRLVRGVYQRPESSGISGWWLLPVGALAGIVGYFAGAGVGAAAAVVKTCEMPKSQRDKLFENCAA